MLIPMLIVTMASTAATVLVVDNMVADDTVADNVVADDTVADNTHGRGEHGQVEWQRIVQRVRPQMPLVRG